MRLSGCPRRHSRRAVVAGPTRWRRSGRARSCQCCGPYRGCGRSLCCARCSAVTPGFPTICAAPWSAESGYGRHYMVRRGTSSSGRNTRPVSKVCRTSPTLRNSACRLLTCGSSTGCTISAWRSPVEGSTRAWCWAARVSLPWPKGCRTRSGPWVAHPRRHRSESLWASFRNLDRDAVEYLTPLRCRALCAHYGMTPTRNNPGVAHENGSIEGSHTHISRWPCSRRCCCVAAATLLTSMRIAASSMRWSGRANWPAQGARDRAGAAQCPARVRRTDDFEEELVTVTRSGGFFLRRIFYTVPSPDRPSPSGQIV